MGRKRPAPFCLTEIFLEVCFLAEKKKNTAQICTELALPVAEQIGVELWDVRFEKEGTEW